MKLENKFKIYIILLLVVVTSGIALLFNGPTYAKYVSNSILNYNLKSEELYLSSDFLDTLEVQNVNNLWDGSSVYFNIKNNLNNFLITEYNIDYSVACVIDGEAASYAECRMNGTQSNVYNSTLQSAWVCKDISSGTVIETLQTKEECEASFYKWTSIPVNNDLYFDIVLTNSGYSINDIVVNVTLNTTSSYYKSIIGKFILKKVNLSEENVTMNFQNYNNYNNLVVTNTTNANKCVKVSWDPSKLLIDAGGNYSSYTVDTENYMNSIIFNIEAKKIKNFKFYNRNLNEIYNVNEFLLENSSEC